MLFVNKNKVATVELIDKTTIEGKICEIKSEENENENNQIDKDYFYIIEDGEGSLDESNVNNNITS